MSGENLTPITRKEMFLAKASGQDVKTPEPITREEMFLSNIGSNGGSSFPVKEFFEGTCKELTLTDVTTLRGYSIYGISSIERISLQNTEKIATYAIYNCSSLTEVNLFEGLITMDGNSIANCTQIQSIIFPSTLQSIGWNAMSGCSGLKTVTFLGKPTSIGSTFNSTVFPSTVETINVPWSEGEVGGAPWGASSATINYNYKGD